MFRTASSAIGQISHVGKVGIACLIDPAISGVAKAVKPLAMIINTNQAVKQP